MFGHFMVPFDDVALQLVVAEPILDPEGCERYDPDRQHPLGQETLHDTDGVGVEIGIVVSIVGSIAPSDGRLEVVPAFIVDHQVGMDAKAQQSQADDVVGRVRHRLAETEHLDVLRGKSLGKHLLEKPGPGGLVRLAPLSPRRRPTQADDEEVVLPLLARKLTRAKAVGIVLDDHLRMRLRNVDDALLQRLADVREKRVLDEPFVALRGSDECFGAVTASQIDFRGG
jgi:hypothetical protein